MNEKQSSRWQKLAAVLQATFESALAAPEKPSTIDIIAKAPAAIRLLGRRVVADVVEIGQRLIAVRERIQGEFVQWLEREFGWSAVQAYKLTDVAKSFLPYGNEAATIDISAIYLLSAPSTRAPGHPTELSDHGRRTCGVASARGWSGR